MINKETNIMIDLETMAVSNNAAIVSIGAVAFDFTDGIIDEFYLNVDLQSCLDKGLEVDGIVVTWWMQQSQEARESLVTGKHAALSDALVTFERFITKQPKFLESKVWGNGVDFDNVILANAYAACNFSLPWKFRNNMCYRTLKNLHPEIEGVKPEVAHNALDDAKAQVKHLIDINNIHFVDYGEKPVTIEK